MLFLKSSLLLFVLTICHTASAADSSRPLWGDLQPGDHGVGFRVEFLENTNEAGASDPSGRVLEIMLWYPVKPDSGSQQAMRFEDYVARLHQFRNGYTAAELAEWLSVAVTGNPHGLSAQDAAEILHGSMAAVQNAPEADASFPLVLWTMRHETMAAQSVLSEYLASHGFVVAFVRYRDMPLPLPWTIDTLEEKQRMFSVALRDLEFGLAEIGEYRNVDASHVAIMNWSYAAEASPRLQAKNSNVKIVIGLSSNPLSSTGVFLGSKAGAELSIEDLTVPYVIMSERIGSDGKERSVPEILGSLRAAYYLRYEELSHGNFNVLEGMIPGVFGIEEVQPWSKGGLVAKTGYESIAQNSLRYLNRYLKQQKIQTASDAGPDQSGAIYTLLRFGEE